MAITFAFLGWSFYQMSGGSEYAPSDNSIQARVGTADAQAPKVQVARLDDQASSDDDSGVVTRSVSSLADLDLSGENRVVVTLAAVDATDIPEPARSEAVALDIEAAVAEANAEIAAAEVASAAVTSGEDQPVADSVLTGFVGEQVFSLETYVMQQDSSYTPTTQGSLQGSVDGDIRRVSGNSVNMRAGPGTDYQKVGNLTKGTQIAVLEEPGNGWVMLEVVSTGETGWMADWLLTASN
ncbi:MAG: SH3 domain-containing protein [Roseovarius sp.]